MNNTSFKKILIVHNTYHHKGGEDSVVAEEIRALQENGYAVVYKEFNNDNFSKFSLHSLLFPVILVFNLKSFLQIFFLIRSQKINVMHAHNIFYHASPSVFWAAKLAGARTVATLHNYRLFCLNATLFRNKDSCFDCIQNKNFKKGIKEKCFKSSALYSSALAFTINFHKKIHTWQNKVDRIIVINKFTEQLLLNDNISSEKIVLKPNFVKNDLYRDYSNRNDFYLFIGRLDELKGIAYLMDAFKKLGRKLLIVGSGEMQDYVRDNCSEQIIYAGVKSKAEVIDLLIRCKALVFPSIGIEVMPMTIIEAFSCGTIPIAAASVNTEAMIKNGETGFLFKPKDEEDLIRTVQYFETLPKVQLNELSCQARQKFLNVYSEEHHLKIIKDIYSGNS